MENQRDIFEGLTGGDERYQVFFEHSPVGMVIWDVRDGIRFVAVNQAMADLKKAPAHECIGKRIEEVFGHDRDFIANQMDAVRVVQETRAPLSRESSLRLPDGKRLSYKAYYYPLEEVAGRVVSIGVAVADETERIRGEEERGRLQDKLLHSQKLEAVGRLAAGIAHDFNNMLAPILGYTEIVLEDLPPGHPNANRLEQVRVAAERSKKLVSQLLSYSRKQMLTMVPIDVNLLIHQMEPMVRRMLRDDIELSVHFEAERSVVKADRSQLEHVVMNLAVNAQDAMPAGGRLEIKTADTTLGEASSDDADAPRAGDYVVLSVRDVGLGMDAGTQQRIFEPFFSTKAVGESSGLGLATVYGTVKQHGGHIVVESQPGQGSCFRISLPVIEDHAARKGRDDAKGPTQKKPERIVVVEDQEIVRDLARVVLERQGYEVLAVENADQCLALFDRLEGQVGLLITDVVMPGRNGKQLYDELARRYRGLKVLFMSGYDEGFLAEKGVVGDALPVLSKPFSIRDIEQKVRSLLD